METLALVHGDLMIDGTGALQTFSGAQRIRQDLTLALAEEYGADRFHPRWGSILKSYLGNPITSNLQQLVKAEVNRVTQNYIVVQQNNILRASTLGMTETFDTSDVVRSITGINVTTAIDTIYVTATLTTLDQQTITINRQVGT